MMLRRLYPIFYALSTLGVAWAQTTDPGTCNPPVQFFNQKIDHGTNGAASDGENTFQQRYQLIKEHWQPGGPILLYISPQSDTMACGEANILPEWAKELGGAVATLEHRGFGLSLPNNSSDLVEKYQSLTLDNILADYAYFAQFIKDGNDGMDDAPVITFGGSYPAHLSALMRLNHPDDVFGSVAWAAPMNGFGTPESDPVDQYNFVTFVSNVYRDQSAEAAAKIQHAFTVLDDKIKFEKYEEIAHDFNLCSVPQNQSDIQEFYISFLVTSYALNAEFSYGFEVFPTVQPNSLPRLINRTLELSEPMEILNASLVQYFTPDTYPCIPLGGYDGANVAISTTTFLYLGCEAYPLETWAIPEGTIFLPSEGAMPGRIEMCKDAYNLTVPDGEEHKTRYNFTTEDIAKAQRLLFTSGEFDPVSGNSPLQLLGRVEPDRNASRTLSVPEGAHGEESFPSANITKPSVAHIQTVQLQILKEWLGMT